MVDFHEVNNINQVNLTQIFNYKEWGQLILNLLGEYKIENAILAIEVVDYLSKRDEFNIDEKDLKISLKI